MDATTSYRATKGNPIPYKMEGIGVDFDAPLLNRYGHCIDEFIGINDEHGLGMLQTMARSYGVLCGPSSGAVAYGTREYVKNLDSAAVAVMIIGDSGRAYLSKEYWKDEPISVHQQASESQLLS